MHLGQGLNLAKFQLLSWVFLKLQSLTQKHPEQSVSATSELFKLTISTLFRCYRSEKAVFNTQTHTCRKNAQDTIR